MRMSMLLIAAMRRLAEGEVGVEGDGVTVGRFEAAVVPATLLPMRPWTAYQPPLDRLLVVWPFRPVAIE